MARIDHTDDWRERHAPTISTFESLALDAYSHLPEEFRALATNLTIEIDDFPSEAAAHDTKRLFGLLEDYIRLAPEQYLWLYKKFKGRPAPLPDVYAR